MKKLASLILTVALFLLAPLNAMEPAANQDLVSHAGLQREHVLLVLWVNASGTGGTKDGGDARSYVATSSMPLPAFEEAKNYLVKSTSGGYFQGRKVPNAFGDNDTYNGYGYNQWHGLHRTQKAIEALQASSKAGPITLEGISKLYVSVWEEVREKECAQMNALIKAGKMDEAITMYTYHSLRSDADCIGVTKAMELDPQMKEGVQAFASGLAHRQMMKQPQSEDVPSHGKTISATPPSTPNHPLPPASHREEKSAQQHDFSPETKKMMGPGLRKMFGGKEP